MHITAVACTTDCTQAQTQACSRFYYLAGQTKLTHDAFGVGRLSRHFVVAVAVVAVKGFDVA